MNLYKDFGNLKMPKEPLNKMADATYYDPKFVLEKAIQKAIEGGYNAPDFRVSPRADRFSIIYSESDSWVGEINSLIFNHDFAKALWGVGTVSFEYSDGSTTPEFPFNNWQYHLQKMVIADDPIKYLGENI